MTDLELILSIIGLTLLLALLILVIVLLSKKPKENPYQVEAIGALKGQIDRLQGDIAHDLADTLKEELAKIKDANALQSKENIEKMGQLENKLTKSLSDDVGKITEKVDAKFLEINTKIEEKIFQGFKTTTKTVEGVVEKLALLEQAQKNIQELSGQVVNLNNVLSNNQSRGKFGEFQLSSILHQVFGDTKGLYELQAELKVKGRETVRPDAQIHLPEPNHIVCIDAKFPFQSYQKIFDRQNNEDVSELKKQFSAEIIKHIKDVAKKYIIDSVTAPQALMFIPSDGIFAYIHVELDKVIEEAQKVNVIITSPATLQPMLATMNLLIVDYNRSKNLKTINEQLIKLSKDFAKFTEEWTKLSKNLSTANSAREQLDRSVDKITGKFQQIKGSQIGELPENSLEDTENNDV